MRRAGCLIILIFIGVAVSQVLVSQEEEQEQEIKLKQRQAGYIDERFHHYDKSKSTSFKIMMLPIFTLSFSNFFPFQIREEDKNKDGLVYIPDYFSFQYGLGSVFEFYEVNNLNGRLRKEGWREVNIYNYLYV